MMTSFKVYWKSQTQGTTNRRKSLWVLPLITASQCEAYTQHLVCPIDMYLVEERLLLSCMLKWFLEDSKPLVQWHMSFREEGWDFEREREDISYIKALVWALLITDTSWEELGACDRQNGWWKHLPLSSGHLPTDVCSFKAVKKPPELLS